MKFLSNILLASGILSLLVLIVVFHLFNEYDAEFKDYIKLFLYLMPVIMIFLSYHKKYIIQKYDFEPITAAAEVFNEITDSQQLNGIMPLNSFLGGDEDDLIIDNIPKSITCNNIV